MVVYNITSLKIGRGFSVLSQQDWLLAVPEQLYILDTWLYLDTGRRGQWCSLIFYAMLSPLTVVNGITRGIKS